MELLELFGGLISVFLDVIAAIVDDSGNKTDRGKGKLPSEKYVTR